MFNWLKSRLYNGVFYYWHSSYHKWMRSIAKSDLETLKKELDAIIQVKSENPKNVYRLDMLEGQEAIVRRLIKEIER